MILIILKIQDSKSTEKIWFTLVPSGLFVNTLFLAEIVSMQS